MAVQLFKLRNVPDDEADEIRQLLTDNDIQYYETSPGVFGFSAPALWLHDKDQKERAVELLQQYQEERREKAQKLYADQVSKGEQRTFFIIAKENPVRFIFYIALIALILYFSIKPFISLGLAP